MNTVLKRALLANAAFSALCGLGLVVLGGGLAELIGLGSPIVYRVIGLGLALFAGVVGWSATRTPINAFVASLISAADLLWVLGTAIVIVLTYPSLRPLGIVVMLAVAALVLGLALRQLHGIELTFAVPGKPHTSRLCVAVATPVSADDLWLRIADLGNIQRYSPNLARVSLRNQARAGVDAVRECTSRTGQTWAEHCTRFDPVARAIDMRFLASEAGFPYPFGTMTGGWAVVPLAAGSEVTIWFEVTPKYAVLEPFILALMSKDLAQSFGDIVTRMVMDAQGAPTPTPMPVNVLAAQHGVSYRLARC